MKKILVSIKNQLSFESLFYIFIGALITSFGLYHIHQQCGTSEGGIMGMVLLVHHWTGIPSSIMTFLLDSICYWMAWKYLGGMFIVRAVISTAFMSLCLAFWALFPPFLSGLSPLMAAIYGALCIGIGVGIMIYNGGSSGGDDALALTLSKTFHWRLSKTYFICDLTVLVLSLSYIRLERIFYSLITVMLSSYLIDKIQQFPHMSGVILKDRS